MPASVTYQFTQPLSLPARQAYEWCTNYQPDDLALMKEKGQRKIQRITQDTIILTEEISSGRKKIRKTKLVKLDPAELSWYNVHIAGPNRHSTFLYKIRPDGKTRSRLTFTGLFVVYDKPPPTARKLRQIAYREKRYDANAWKQLARAMTADKKRSHHAAV